MKKLLLPILFLLMMIPAMSQNYVHIFGTITDTATGNPIPYHAVTISNDSTGGWVYYQTVYTDINGFYGDTIPVALNSGGFLYVRTSDCQNYLHEAVVSYMPSVLNFTVDFAICDASNPCQAGFTNQQSQPLTVQFTDASIGGGTTRQWMFGDGATSTQMNPQHIYGMPGYYNVTLSIGALGTTCYQTISQTVYVWDSILSGCNAQFSYYADTLNTMNVIHFLDQSTTGTGHIDSWIWQFGDGTSQTVTFPGNPNVTHTYATPGTYNACLTIHGSDSSCYDVTCQTIQVGSNTGCVAQFIHSVPTSTSYPTLFTDQSVGGGGSPIISWNWNFGDPISGTNNTSSLQNPSHMFSVAGTYNVCLTIQGADSTCYDMTCQTIYVTGDTTGCQANFNYNVSPTSGNLTVYFNDLSTGNPTSWFWNFGDGTSSNIQNPVVHTYAAPGTYNVCLTISGNNCTSTFCQNVVIQDSTNYHQVYGQVFAGNFPINLGMAMIFSVDTSLNYQPFVAVCPIDSNGVYYFTLVPDGNYYIMAIPFDSNGYLPTYYGNTISWEQATLVSLGIAANPYNINLVASGQMAAGPGSASGQINMGDVSSSMVDKINMILMNDQNQPIGFTTVSTSGTFSFPTMAYGTYYLHAEMPGVTSDYVMITLSAEKPHADVVMTFTGNSILGIRNDVGLVDRYSVYPNPVIDHLTVTIDMKKDVRVEVELYNMTGQLVSRNLAVLNQGSNTLTIPVAALQSGIYSLRIYSNEGVILNTKIVKTR